MSNPTRYLWMACSGTLVLLILLSWPLWFGQPRFPAVPLLSMAHAVPPLFDGLGLLTLAVGLATGGVAVARHSQKLLSVASILCVVSMGWLIIMNQHRLQPWFLHGFCILLCVGCCGFPVARRPLQLLTVSIYFFSGLSKLDFQFCHTVGQEFVASLVGLIGLDAASIDEQHRLTLALLLPVAEILVAIALLFRRIQRGALWVATAMHMVLILVLSPIGLGHQPAVLLWNAGLVGLLWLLFGTTSADDEASPPAHQNLLSKFASGFVMTVCIAPLGNLIGVYDHWPAWGLYAPSNSRVNLWVLEHSVTEDLPATVLEHLESPRGNAPWRRLHIDRMSVNLLHVPIYPEDRFQLGVATALIQRYGWQNSFRLQIQSASNRFDGERSSEELTRIEQVIQCAKRYRLGARPREER